jgi:hypothetical protein
MVFQHPVAPLKDSIHGGQSCRETFCPARRIFERYVVTLVIDFFSFLLDSWGGVRLSPLGTSATTGLFYQPRMVDDECGAVSGMKIGGEN